MKTSTNKLNQAIERMTTGAKINHAKDNAANYSISTNMTTKMSAYKVAEDNVAMGMDMVATASDTLSEMQNHAERLRALATQARNGTYGAQSLSAIQSEANALTKEIERLYSTAEYNGVKLFDVVEKKTTDFEVPTVNSQGFIKDIDRIDVTGMKRLSEVENRNVALPDGEYAICTEEDLLALVELANNGKLSAGDTFVMGADIDVGKYCEDNMATGGWTPIGDYSSATSKVFRGTFDGNGYTISNVKIDRATSDYQGLFGYVNINGVIKNLKVENVDIVGKNNVGGIVGYLCRASIENAVVTGFLNGEKNVGGVAGAFTKSNLNNSCTEITVNGDNCVGGLVGYGDSHASIDSCFASGKVYGISSQIGGIIGWINPGTISNCYSSTDIYAEDASNVGGIVGQLYYSKVFDSYSTGDIYGKATVAGLVGNSYSNYSTSSICQIKNCYTTAYVSGKIGVGGLVGVLYGEIENCTMKGSVRNLNSGGTVSGIVASSEQEFSIKDCSFEGTVENNSKINFLISSIATKVSEINISGCQIVSKVENPNATLIGSVAPSVACNINISNCTYNSYYDEIGTPLIKSQNANATINMENVSANLFENNLNMQVGVNSDKNSSLNLSTSFFINDFDKLKNVTSGDDYFTTIDNFINLISEKQVQFGAMQNRLESALDEITIQYENLASSRSTIRDADMAELSSTYIQQQILQQAAATLMATANQSPAIAFQLI